MVFRVVAHPHYNRDQAASAIRPRSVFLGCGAVGRRRASIRRLPRQCLHPKHPPAADTYAREVHDEAYRRGFWEQGIRMQQLAEQGGERGGLTTEFGAIRDELVDLWR